MKENKTYYLVEIKKPFSYGLIEAYKIFKEKDFTKWLQNFNTLSTDAELVVNNFSFPILLDDFKITPIDRKSYKNFKFFNKLSYGVLDVFDTTKYSTDVFSNTEGEKWECKEVDENSDVHYRFINSVNDIISNYYPSWEIPEEFLDKMKYIGRRYAILTLTEDIDPYDDDRFSDITSIDKIRKDDSNEWEYHIRLKPQQKPFYV